MDVSALTAEELGEFLRGFEDCSLPKERWTHGAHIAMATVYLRRYGDGVLPRVRAAIQTFNAAKGGAPTLYHETLTIFWLAVVAEFLRACDGLGDVDAVKRSVGAYGSRSKMHTEFYSFDVVANDAARTGWVAPDVREVVVRFALDK